MGCVYLALNTVNNKAYIGKTVYHLKKRKNEHLYEAVKVTNIAFHRALKKYGVDKFIWRILYRSDDEKLLNQKEIFFIASKNTIVPNGYNLSTGGEGVSGVPCTEEMKAYLSKALLKAWKNPENKERHKQAMRKWADNLTDEDKLKLSQGGKNNKGISKPKGFGEIVRLRMTGTVSTFKGRKHSEETKLLMSQKALGKPKSEITKEKLRIINTGRHNSEESKNKNRLISLALWQDPEYREKMKSNQFKKKG